MNDSNKEELRQSSNLDFLEEENLSESVRKRVIALRGSRELRILIFSEMQKVLSDKPSSEFEAVARFHEARGLSSLINKIK